MPMRRTPLSAVIAGLALTIALLAACAPETVKLRAMPAPVAAAMASLHTATDEAAAEAAANDVLSFFMQSGSASVDALMERAGLAEIHSDLPKAQALLDQAISLKPDFAEAYARRAAIAFTGKDFKSAHRDLTEAVRLEPRHFAAWAGLGAVNEALQQPAEALKAYRAALALYPKFPPARDGEARTARIVEGVET